MDRTGSIFVKVEEQRGVSPTIVAVLASAVLEWFLIFLLFVDASFSYLVTKFARYNKLPVPCLLCSRLDHILGKEKDGFCWDLICDGHKLKISSVVLCRHHNKLVDVHEICENCLFSFATVNKSNAETYRLLVGKLGDEPHQRLDHDPSLGDHGLSASHERKCSCCNDQWVSRGDTSLLFRTQSIDYESADVGPPSFATKLHDRNEQDEMKDVSFKEMKTYQTGKRIIDLLPHVEYEKVRMTSDSESEAVFGVDDCANLCCVTEQGKENLESNGHEKDLPIEDLVTEKCIDHPTALTEPLIVESEPQEEASDLLSAAPASLEHGLEELNWEHVAHKKDFSASDLISISDVLTSSDAILSSLDDSGDKLHVVKVAESEKDVMSCSEMIELPIISNRTNEKQSDLRSTAGDSGPQMPSTLELGDAYKLALGSRGRQLSGKLSFKDSSRMSGDLKLLLSQLSAARGVEPLYDISPRISGNIDEFRISDVSASVGIQILQKRISLERNESGLSVDGSIVSEIEGESEVDRLKRQVEHDRKLLSALYKELEEERNASAVAANQAMAMITRLQEEKAALQMEALQFIRMMEEQAEYDGEDLQRVNDLLTDKEREIQDLEAELEAYKEKLRDLSQIENIVEANPESNRFYAVPKQTDGISTQPNVIISYSDGDMPDSCSETHDATKYKDGDIDLKPLPECKNESLFILKSLRKLEKKLLRFSSDEGASFISNGENLLADEKLKTGNCRQQNSITASPRDGEMEKDGFFEDSVLHEESQCVEAESVGQNEDNLQSCPVSGELQHGKLTCPDAELDTLRKEFLLLSDRLEALETECSFLENSIKSMSKGDEGLKFIEDIACQVRELHAIVSKSRN